jgi:glucosamine--fructose-6-phosphate aminotransferase (isomerizing)
MNAEAFLADLETKPARLRALAEVIATSPWAAATTGAQRVVFLGMGSSRYAASVIAARLRALGLDAVAEYASARRGYAGGPGTLAIAISASGRTAETVAALRRHRDAGSAVIALTNDPTSAVAAVGSAVVELGAGREEGGVACRTFQHTLASLLALEDRVAGRDPRGRSATIAAAADATEDLLARRSEWLPQATEILTSTGHVFVIAPHERLSSAEQGALMLREGPRLVAGASETGDWLHVDVYLTKPLDYRALLFAGSGFDAEVLGWMREREATVVGVGADLEGSDLTIRYRGDEDEDVALLTEVLIPELVAATVWRRQG